MLGLAGAVALTRYLQSMLFGVTPLDAVTFVTVPLAFAAVAAVASCVPAYRATRVDPILALRAEPDRDVALGDQRSRSAASPPESLE